MATTTTTQYNTAIATEHIADMIIEESRARSVVLQLVNQYSLAGMRTGTLQYNRVNDSGQASVATEGVAFTATTQLGLTSGTATPAENAVAMILVTNDAIEERTGLVGAAQLFNRGSVEQMVGALSLEARVAGAMVREKIENDLTGLFASLSRSVGTTTQNITLANFDAALLTLETGEDLPPHADNGGIVASLDKQQIGDLRAEMLVTSGGVAGALWEGRDAPGAGDRGMNGFKFNLLGVDVYNHGIGVRQTANAGADVVGAMFVRGSGAPEMGGGGVPGCFAYCEARPVQVTVEGDHRERGAEIQVNSKHICFERIDNWGVALITDA